MASSSELAGLVDRLRAARDRILDQRAALDAGAPWPLAVRFGVEPEARWGPPETLAHVAEMVPYWQGEIERILAAGKPMPFGRVATDELRLAVIARDRSLPVRELLSRLDSSVERLAGRLGRLTPDEAARTGSHPTLGEMAVALIAERFVVGHLEDHVTQLSAAIEHPSG